MTTFLSSVDQASDEANEDTDATAGRGQAGDLFALLCQRRGWNASYLSAIEDARHAPLKDIDAMVAQLVEIRHAGRKIVIAPDFDMDGIASGVLGYAGLAELGFDVQLHIPDYTRGHDLRPEDIDEIAAAWPTTAVLLTCDGGVNSHEGIAAARTRGWTTLVTDHHQELPPGSSADITVDPCRMDETYAHTGICGAHVLYQVLEAYTAAHQPDKLWSIGLLRLFAGLGTVSDVMPLLYENRQLVRDSLSLARLLYAAPPKTIPTRWGSMEADLDAVNPDDALLLKLLATESHHPVFTTAFAGFAAVLAAFTQVGKLRDVDDLNEGFYGFFLAPAMNSPRRTGAPLLPCFEAFIADTTQQRISNARAVIENNELRKQLTITGLEQLTAGDQPLAPWVYFSDAYPGMYGLLAAQMMQHHDHPVVVVGTPHRVDEPAGGSGRAPGWFNIIDTLESHPGMTAIGHQQACGVRVDSAARLSQLADVLKQETAVALLGMDAGQRIGDLVLGAEADCDAGLDEADALMELTRRLESLRPFGQGIPEPRVQLALDPYGLRVDVMGSEKQHVRIVTRTGLACLWWNAAEHADALRQRVIPLEETDDADHADGEGSGSSRAAATSAAPAGALRFTAKLALNVFRDTTRLQAVVEAPLFELDS